MHGQLQFGEFVKIFGRQLSSFSSVLAALKAFAEGQLHVVETKPSQQILDLFRSLTRFADAFERCIRCFFTGANGEQLFALKLPATRGAFGIQGAFAVRAIEGGTRLGHARAILFEQGRAIFAYAAHVGEEHAVAAQAAGQAKSVSQFRHSQSSSMPTGQWSLPSTCGRMKARLSRGRNALESRK